MARGITLDELGGNVKPNGIPLKKPKKPKKKREKQNKKPANNRDIVYDDLFDQYRYNNNVGYGRNNWYVEQPIVRRGFWDKGFQALGFLLLLSLFAFSVIVVIGIILEVAQFISDYCGEICCLLGGLYLLAGVEY